MITVKRFKPMDEFVTENGDHYGGYETGSTVYAVVNKSGEVLHRQTAFGDWKTHFYSSKKRAMAIADIFNGKGE